MNTTEFIQTLIEEFNWTLEPGFKTNEVLIKRPYEGPISWICSEYCSIRVLADQGIVNIIGTAPGVCIELADPQSIDTIMDWFNNDVEWCKSTKGIGEHESDRVLLPGEDIDDQCDNIF
jgi:hypothetical protein